MQHVLPSLIFALALLPAIAFAAVVSIEVDTRGEDINALEGTLVLPDGITARAESGNSAISFWVEEPRVQGGRVRFAGITPGGFSGVFPIFSIQGAFTPKELDEARFEDVVALKNDGEGTQVPVSLALSMAPFLGDTEPPEDFTPAIARDAHVFDGMYFLVFATQDKNSGIARYEVREERWGRFKEAESPYKLRHQALDREIYVKAIDNAGNERVAVVPAAAPRAWWVHPWLFSILIVIALIALAYKRQWARSLK